MSPNVVNNLVKVSQEHTHVIVKGAGGLQGLPGPAGAGLKIDGSVDTYAELPWHLTESDAGVSYFVQADGLLYVWSGIQWPAEGSGAQFQGPRGIQGPPGEKGEDGEPGPAGQDGPAGADGFTPIVTTEEIEDGIRINIVNKTGTTSTDIDYKNIPDGVITTSKLADDAVTNDKIADTAVKSANIDWTTMGGTDYFSQITWTTGIGTSNITGYWIKYDNNIVVFSLDLDVSSVTTGGLLLTTNFPEAIRPGRDFFIPGWIKWQSGINDICALRYRNGDTQKDLQLVPAQSQTALRTFTFTGSYVAGA